MFIDNVIWLDEILDKIKRKHDVNPQEVEQVLLGNVKCRRDKKSKINPEEYIYRAFGRTYSGRYLFIVFIYKPKNTALVLTARDMSNKEKDYYEKIK